MPSRRRRNRERSDAIIGAIVVGGIVVIWVITRIVAYLSENMWIVYTALGLILVVIVTMIIMTIRKINHYKTTPYYKDTKTPWRKLKKPGMQFECDVYNRLAEALPNTKLLPNALIPRINAVNEYFEIDILLFSTKGIFALELKDWAGFIYGDTENETWTIGKLKDKKRRALSVYSPYKQNERHIEDLDKIYPHPYLNHIIFSNRGNIGQGMEEATRYEGFLARYYQLEDILDTQTLEQHYHTIAAKLDPSKLPDHIERIKYNQVRYR